MKSKSTFLIQSQTLKARNWPFLVFVLYLSITFLLALNEMIEVSKIQTIVTMIIIMAGLFFLNLPSFIDIKLHQDGFEQKRFLKTRTVTWDDIAKVDVEWVYHGHGATMQLKFQIKDSKSFAIGLTLFNRKNIQILCEAIVLSCPNAVVSIKISQMAEGQFPWYVI